MAEGKRRQQESAHDVLAAEAFAVPAPDPNLRRAAVVLPDDPSGISEPHDILAAEEFAMPAVAGGVRHSGTDSARRVKLVVAAVALLALVGLRRRH